MSFDPATGKCDGVYLHEIKDPNFKRKARKYVRDQGYLVWNDRVYGRMEEISHTDCPYKHLDTETHVLAGQVVELLHHQRGSITVLVLGGQVRFNGQYYYGSSVVDGELVAFAPNQVFRVLSYTEEDRDAEEPSSTDLEKIKALLEQALALCRS
jgi:hypothetical protein